MMKLSTQELFDQYCGDYKLAEHVHRKLDVFTQIQQNYADELQEQHHNNVTDKFRAIDALNIAKREHAETQRIKKLRKRKTSRGMSDTDFVSWAKGREIIWSGWKCKYVRHERGLVYGEHTFVGYRQIHTSETWKVVLS